MDPALERAESVLGWALAAMERAECAHVAFCGGHRELIRQLRRHRPEARVLRQTGRGDARRVPSVPVCLCCIVRARLLSSTVDSFKSGPRNLPLQIWQRIQTLWRLQVIRGRRDVVSALLLEAQRI